MTNQWTALDVANVDPSPLRQFASWMNDARGLVSDVSAIALVTTTLDRRPSARMVLLRYVGERTLGWYSNYDSRKAHEIDHNVHAALLWYVEPLGRQVRIEGAVSKMSATSSDEYFATRPRAHQISAHASAQSQELASRRELEDRVRELTEKFEGHVIARPAHWGGYELTPQYFEFWQHRDDRLHDRVSYKSDDSLNWTLHRLSP